MTLIIYTQQAQNINAAVVNLFIRESETDLVLKWYKQIIWGYSWLHVISISQYKINKKGRQVTHTVSMYIFKAVVSIPKHFIAFSFEHEI